MDYTEIIVLMMKHKSLRIFLAIIAMLAMMLVQIDIIRTYLESALS